MVDTSRVILWAVLTVLHLPILVVPFQYWRKRNLDPINVRRPRVFIISLVALSVGIWCTSLRNLVGLPPDSWLNIVFLSALITSVCESFFVFALSLYIAYNKTKEQMMMYQVVQNSPDTENVNKFIKSIQIFSFLLSEKFAYTWVIAHTLIWLIVTILYLWSQVGFPNVFTSLKDIDEDSAEAGDQALKLVYGRALFTFLWLFVLSRRLRIVQDAFGTKRLLKKIALIAVIILCYNIGLENTIAAMSSLNLQDVITLIFIDAMFIIAFVVPLFQIRKRSRQQTVVEGDTAGGDGKKSDFEAFLLTQEGFEAFKAHLEKEFSVENLLFWKDVNLFCESCDSDDAGKLSSKSIDLAWKIFDKYLSSSAPLEVNLPSEELIKFRKEIFKNRSGDHSSISAAIFNQSASQILRLMEVNSLKRFLKTNPPSWSQFQALREERMVAHQVDTLGSMRPKTQHSTDEVQISMHHHTATPFTATL